MNNFNQNKAKLFFLIGYIFLFFTVCMETDIFLPCLPDVLKYFQTTELKIELIFGINFIGLSLSSFILGPLSDSIGRRPVLLWGMVLFTLFSILIPLSKTIEQMLIYRFFQGVGAGSLFSVMATVLFDKYKNKEAVQMMGVANSAISLGIAFAPMIGMFVNQRYNWQAVFSIVGVCGLLGLAILYFMVPESLPTENKTPFKPKSVISNYKTLFTSRLFLGNCIVAAMMFSMWFLWMGNMALVFKTHIGVSNAQLLFYQTATILSFSVVSFSGKWLIEKLTLPKAKLVGLGVFSIGSFALLIFSFLTPYNAPVLGSIMIVIYAGSSLTFNTYYTEAVEVHPDMKGAANSALNVTRLVFSGIFVTLSGAYFNGTMQVVAFLIAICAIISLVSQVVMLKKQPEILEESKVRT